MDGMDEIKLCEEYLARQDVAIWGRAYDLHQKQSRKRAAIWLAQQLKAVRELEMELASPLGRLEAERGPALPDLLREVGDTTYPFNDFKRTPMISKRTP